MILASQKNIGKRRISGVFLWNPMFLQLKYCLSERWINQSVSASYVNCTFLYCDCRKGKGKMKEEAAARYETCLMRRYMRETEKKTTLSEDQEFTVYYYVSVYLGGRIRNGCLELDSEVYGEEYDSEKHYMFSRKETEKLFSIVTLQEFIELCRRGNLIGMEAFLRDNGIRYSSVTI